MPEPTDPNFLDHLESLKQRFIALVESEKAITAIDAMQIMDQFNAIPPLLDKHVAYHKWFNMSEKDRQLAENDEAMDYFYSSEYQKGDIESKKLWKVFIESLLQIPKQLKSDASGFQSADTNKIDQVDYEFAEQQIKLNARVFKNHFDTFNSEPALPAWEHQFVCFYRNSIYANHVNNAVAFINHLENKFGWGFEFTERKEELANFLHATSNSFHSYFNGDVKTLPSTASTFYIVSDFTTVGEHGGLGLLQEFKNPFIKNPRVKVYLNDFLDLTSIIGSLSESSTQVMMKEYGVSISFEDIHNSLRDTWNQNSDSKMTPTQIYASMRFLGKNQSNVIGWDSSKRQYLIRKEHISEKQFTVAVRKALQLWEVDYGA